MKNTLLALGIVLFLIGVTLFAGGMWFSEWENKEYNEVIKHPAPTWLKNGSIVSGISLIVIGVALLVSSMTK